MPSQMTAWWHEDEICWVAECESCGVPMVVWKRHGTDPDEAERAHMLAHLHRVAEGHGPRRYWIDETRRSIPDHFHVHARRAWGS